MTRLSFVPQRAHTAAIGGRSARSFCGFQSALPCLIHGEREIDGLAPAMEDRAQRGLVRVHLGDARMVLERVRHRLYRTEQAMGISARSI